MIRRGVCLILCLPLCVLLGYVGSGFLPKVYYSKVTMEAESDHFWTDSFDGDKSKREARFVSHIFQTIQSKEVLYSAIHELNRTKKGSLGAQQLSEVEIYFKLLKMMEIKTLRHTDLIEIGVYSRDPQEAADIANVIAMEYRKKRIEDNEKIFALNLMQLKDELENQRKKMEEARVEMTRIRERDNIDDPTPEKMDPEAKNFSEEYLSAKKKYLEEKQLFDSAEKRYLTERMERQISYQPARIWEKAEPAKTPVYPNMLIVVLISTGIGLIFAIPGAVLVWKGRRMMESVSGSIKKTRSQRFWRVVFWAIVADAILAAGYSLWTLRDLYEIETGMDVSRSRLAGSFDGVSTLCFIMILVLVLVLLAPPGYRLLLRGLHGKKVG